MSVPMWTPEIVVDADRARAMIAARFPELRAERVERLGQGWDNAAYLVDGTAVFRFPQRGIAAPLIATEIAVLPLIAPAVAPVAIPVPRWVGTPDDAYPWRFAGYPLLSGTPVDVVNPDDAALAPLARPLGRFLRALHGIDTAPAIAAGLPPDVIGRLDPAKRVPQVRERLATLASRGVVREADAAALLERFIAEAPDGAPARLAVLHGDLYARHLLLDESAALAGVIDWGDVHLGDPAVDLSVVHEIVPAGAHGEFFAEYGSVDERTWRRARWRAIHHAILVAENGSAIGDTSLADGGLAGLRRIGALA
jgi:aminoglycoside phosphotransferase (APT) family kinase protein